MKPKHPAFHPSSAVPASAAGHSAASSRPAPESQTTARLQNFLRAAIPSADDPAARLETSAQSDESRQATESRPRSAISNPLSEFSKPSSAALHHALAARDESHRQAFAQLEARLAAAEQNLTDLSGQLREMR